LATGVVVVALGRATRLLRYVQDSSKEYIAAVRLGIATDTLDAQGEVLASQPMPVSREQFERALDGFRGPIEQVPPMVSALKMGGRRLYEMARAGEVVDREPRLVQIDRLEVVDFIPGDFPLAVIEVVCSKGTYIRVLADDIARVLGGRAHLEALRRIRVGGFRAEHALALDALDQWSEHLLAPVAATSGMARLAASAEQLERVAHGLPLVIAPGTGAVAITDEDGRLVAVYRSAPSGLARAEVVLA
jgi:tRNA pseudouridine55 synthase